MITILNPPATETNPLVIRRVSLPSSNYDSEVVAVSGRFARVNVRTGHDLAFIRMLQHGTDYYAPAKGDGILIRADLLVR